MRFTLLPLVVPSLALLGFIYGMDWLYTRSYDRSFAWGLVLISAAAMIVGNALHVWSVNDRIRTLEEGFDRLADNVYDAVNRKLKGSSS